MTSSTRPHDSGQPSSQDGNSAAHLRWHMSRARLEAEQHENERGNFENSPIGRSMCFLLLTSTSFCCGAGATYTLLSADSHIILAHYMLTQFRDKIN
jgi:hypothetical protein